MMIRGRIAIVSGCGWPLFMFKIGDRMKKFRDFVDPNDGPLDINTTIIINENSVWEII